MLAILRIIEDTTVDGPGFRTAVYAAGCPNQCPGCHNPESWDIGNGRLMKSEEILDIILADPFADVTFTGGDPMFQPEGFAELAEAIKRHSTKNIWCYTGYLYEQLVKDETQRRLLQHIDVLVDGPFVQAQQDETLLFRGSRNQRLIDVPASLASHSIVLFQPDFR
ncbi:MAG: anaerobic ribonucleoside-triphosphate reductase activating protein [Bacteroidaceae bacterium]|nr:anaerobic ribonucleoside-triphosphate reductase activating protein [Bacteroidaceae bacterium]